MIKSSKLFVILVGVFCACFVIALGLHSIITKNIEYTVTFNGNGGTLVSGEEVQVLKYRESPQYPKYERLGYKFDGWDKKWFAWRSSDITIKASWKMITNPLNPLYELTDYSSETRYHVVAPVTYLNTNQQQAILQYIIDEKPQPGDIEYNSLSVWEKIFVNSSPEDIIMEISKAGLSYDKMSDAIVYLSGTENAEDLDQIVAGGVWEDNRDWSLFDDITYLVKLKEKAGMEYSKATKSIFSTMFNLPQFIYKGINIGSFDFKDMFGSAKDSYLYVSATHTDIDNIKRQERKIAHQFFNIGLSGDEFARLALQVINYAKYVAESMHIESETDIDYDDYVKENLSYDTLVFFKAFKQFSQNKARTVQLFGYYYDFNKNVFEKTDDDTFEKELMYSHMDIYSDAQFIQYVNLQRASYVNSYRYTAAFYQSFYQVHFQFQDLLESFDLEVYDMETAFTDASLKYSSEMKKGMDTGFAQKLMLYDHLFIYTANETTLRGYNWANTAYQQVKNAGSKPHRDEREFLLNMEKLKVADYILMNMTNSQLSSVMRYHIMTYSGDMIRNIQSEKKAALILQARISDLAVETDQQEIEGLEIALNSINQNIIQLKQRYTDIMPYNMFTSAAAINWKGIRTEIKVVLEENYTVYYSGTEKLEAFNHLLIKKKLYNPDSSEFNEDVDDIDLAYEDYDTEYAISRFLFYYDVFLLKELSK